MLGFSQLSKPIKWQNLLEKGKNCRTAFRTGAKIHFSEKNILGLGALNKEPIKSYHGVIVKYYSLHLHSGIRRVKP